MQSSLCALLSRPVRPSAGSNLKILVRLQAQWPHCPGLQGDGARSAPQSAASGLRQAARGALAGVAHSVERCISAGRSALHMCDAAERTALRASYYAAGAAAGIGLGLCLIARRRS